MVGRSKEKKASAHPYLARQMSDFGFWQNPRGSNTRVSTKISPPPSTLSHRVLKAQCDELAEQRDTRFILIWATDVV